MIEVFGEGIFDAVKALVGRAGFDSYESSDANIPISKLEYGAEYIKNALSDLEELRVVFKTHGAKLSDLRAAEFESDLKEGLIVRSKLNGVWLDIEQRFRHELFSVSFFVLDNKFKDYLVTPSDMSAKPPFFSPDIVSKFPSVLYEADEAAKCLAFERGTAAVFHLMRTLEIGLKAAAKCLNIPDPTKDAEKNWAVILRKVKEEIDRRGKAVWADQNDKALIAEIYASLDAVRNVWRNPTMHVETKYTMEEAEHIFNAVRGFMMKLSSRMDEQGQPLA